MVLVERKVDINFWMQELGACLPCGVVRGSFILEQGFSFLLVPSLLSQFTTMIVNTAAVESTKHGSPSVIAKLISSSTRGNKHFHNPHCVLSYQAIQSSPVFFSPSAARLCKLARLILRSN